MIRLTLTLLAAIAVTMIVAGDDPDRIVGDGPELVSGAEADTAPAQGQRLALDDAAGAVARALAANDAPAGSKPQAVVQNASLTREVEATVADDTWYVTGSRVNLRAGPSTAEPVVGRVSLGQTAELLDETPDGWMHIRLPDSGQTAYIYGRFLSDSPS